MTQTQWVEIWLSALSDMGVKDVVISPGSRSTPLVLAALRNNRFRCHSVLDERSAAFFALGQAKISGVPSLLICTSGSALSHYLPAVMEAHHAHIPLIVASADRPFELLESGANQTSRQSDLFGKFSRFSMNVPPASCEQELRSAARLAVQAVANALEPLPGLVHFNFQFRKPLESEASSKMQAHKKVGWVPTKRVAPAKSIEEVTELIGQSRKTLIVGGPLLPFRKAEMQKVIRFAEQTQIPVFMESTSQGKWGDYASYKHVQWVDGLDTILRVKNEDLDPDLVFFVGDPPTSKGVEVARRRWGRNVKQVVIHPFLWADPENNVDFMLCASVGDTFERVERCIRERGMNLTKIQPWKKTLQAFDEMVWQNVERLMSSSEGGSAFLSESIILNQIVEMLPNDSVLSIGNSLPVRLVDIWCRHSRHKAIDVVSQRGLSGIDGLVAGAVGAASMSKKPTVLILGDVSFMHDMASLQLAKKVEVPLVIVVVHNGGGRIFEHLPVQTVQDAKGVMPYFTTPHEIQFENLAKQFGLAYACVDQTGEFQAAMGAAIHHVGCTLIEAHVPPHHAKEQLQELHKSLFEKN